MYELSCIKIRDSPMQTDQARLIRAESSYASSAFLK